MNIPDLPTDSLYKFVSLTGVLLSLICFGVLEYRANNQVELDTEILLGKEALGYLKMNRESISTNIDTILNSINEKLATGKTIDDTDLQRYSSARQEYDQLKKQTDNLDREIMFLRKKSEIAENHFNRSQRIIPILFLGGFFGIALAVFGFYFWYHRLQKYQDMLVRHQADLVAQQIAQADANNYSS